MLVDGPAAVVVVVGGGAAADAPAGIVVDDDDGGGAEGWVVGMVGGWCGLRWRNPCVSWWCGVVVGVGGGWVGGGTGAGAPVCDWDWHAVQCIHICIHNSTSMHTHLQHTHQQLEAHLLVVLVVQQLLGVYRWGSQHYPPHHHHHHHQQQQPQQQGQQGQGRVGVV